MCVQQSIYFLLCHTCESYYSNEHLSILSHFICHLVLIAELCFWTQALFPLSGKLLLNRDFTEEFIVECRVKQGDSPSATLFSLVTDTILKQMGLRGNITTHLKQCTAYADDIMLTTRTKQSLIDTVQKLKELWDTVGLLVITITVNTYIIFIDVVKSYSVFSLVVGIPGLAVCVPLGSTIGT